MMNRTTQGAGLTTLRRPDFVLPWLILSSLVMLYGYLVGTDRTSCPDACLLVNLGAAVSLLGLLVLPTDHRWQHPLFNSGVSVITFLLILVILSKGSIPPSILLQSGLSVFTISLLLQSASTLLKSLSGRTIYGPLVVFLLTLLIGSTTLWLGPMAELLVLGDDTVNTIIAVSPLSYLSVAAQYDYLRSDWFYRNTPFGSLRFAYPELAILSTVYLSLSMAIQALNYRMNQVKQTHH